MPPTRTELDETEMIASSLAFLAASERLKTEERHNPLADGSRFETVGEHCWHSALLAIQLGPSLVDASEVSIAHVVQLLVVHDLPEIETGDNSYHKTTPQDRRAADIAGARRLGERFPGLPSHDLWEEFDACQTAAARLANAIDRAHPILMNLWAGGGSWKDGSGALERVEARLREIEVLNPKLGELIGGLVAEAKEAGILC